MSYKIFGIIVWGIASIPVCFMVGVSLGVFSPKLAVAGWILSQVLVLIAMIYVAFIYK